MVWLRARVTRFAGIWLVGQLAIVAGVQTAMYAAGVASVVVTADCACARATMCPMHRGGSASGGRTSHGVCALHGTFDPLGAGLESLLGAFAVVPPIASPFVPPFARLTLTRTVGAASDVFRVPDPPPPRV